MFTSIISGAAVLLALAPSAMALGSAVVMNNCGYTVYAMTISTASEPYAAIPAGGIHNPYTSEGTGFSVKMALNDSLAAPISQFEYTWADGMINYDLSNINGNSASGFPFSAGGLVIEPSVSADSAFPTCVPISCAAGTTVCAAAYNAPDDTRTMVCDQETSLTLTLCPGGSGKRDVHNHGSVHTRQVRHPHGRVWVTV